MKVIEIKRNALVVDCEDWKLLCNVYAMFKEVCDECNGACLDCPLNDFHQTHRCPKKYISDLTDFLENN